MLQDVEDASRAGDDAADDRGHEVTIAVKKKNSDIADACRPKRHAQRASTLHLPDVYPAGDEYILVYEITGS